MQLFDSVFNIIFFLSVYKSSYFRFEVTVQSITPCFDPFLDTYFIPVACFLLFNLMDWAGRSLTALCMWVSIAARMSRTHQSLFQELHLLFKGHVFLYFTKVVIFYLATLFKKPLHTVVFHLFLCCPNNWAQLVQSLGLHQMITREWMNHDGKSKVAWRSEGKERSRAVFIVKEVSGRVREALFLFLAGRL